MASQPTEQGTARSSDHAGKRPCDREPLRTTKGETSWVEERTTPELRTRNNRVNAERSDEKSYSENSSYLLVFCLFSPHRALFEFEFTFSLHLIDRYDMK